MLISTVILVIWIIMLIIEGVPPFEWWWLPISYIIETCAYVGGFILLALIFWR